MTREHKIYRLAHWIASFIIAAVLLSGCYKILYPGEFAVAIYRFHLLPGYLINVCALYVPWLEIVCAFCLLFIPRYRVAALWIVLGLLLLFTTAIAINLWRGSVFGCGCFGRAALDSPLSWLSIARNIGLVLLAGLALNRRGQADG
ncbi:MAG TPA: MauE/DoxX family redox-associated membrane protein [Pontiella sp.]|nr:MauE/DoxX family redox-associated membrane protein [Pontiella sp.]